MNSAFELSWSWVVLDQCVLKMLLLLYLKKKELVVASGDVGQD